MYLTREIFLDKVEKSGSKYWNEGKSYRWEYMSWTIDKMKYINPESIVEAGASGMPLSDKSYLMDYPKHDLNKIPYMILPDIEMLDKTVDTFVALQTIEHLDNHPEIFKEIKRISKSAILSFPYMWKHGDARHKGITDEKMLSWCNVEKWHEEKIIKNRKICVWRWEI